MNLLFLLSVSLTVSRADHIDDRWNAFQAQFGHSFDNLAARKSIFLQTQTAINRHNLRNLSFALGHNLFSILTNEERRQYLGVAQPMGNPRVVPVSASGVVHSLPTVKSVPASLDLRTSPCVGPVKNQGRCGSCWAFAAMAPVEYSKCVKTNNQYVAFSEQQLIDCDTYDSGCNGGWYTNAWYFLYRQNGVATSHSYPYTSSTGVRGSCRFGSNMVGATLTGYAYLPAGNVTGMQSALTTYGPICVAIHIAESFYSYSSGVYNDPACDGLGVNHAVVIVGYGTLNNVPYWIVRNSWGAGWGMSGYVLMQRGVNKCSIETYPAVVQAK